MSLIFDATASKRKLDKVGEEERERAPPPAPREAVRQAARQAADRAVDPCIDCAEWNLELGSRPGDAYVDDVPRYAGDQRAVSTFAVKLLPRGPQPPSPLPMLAVRVHSSRGNRCYASYVVNRVICGAATGEDRAERLGLARYVNAPVLPEDAHPKVRAFALAKLGMSDWYASGDGPKKLLLGYYTSFRGELEEDQQAIEEEDDWFGMDLEAEGSVDYGTFADALEKHVADKNAFSYYTSLVPRGWLNASASGSPHKATLVQRLRASPQLRQLLVEELCNAASLLCGIGRHYDWRLPNIVIAFPGPQRENGAQLQLRVGIVDLHSFDVHEPRQLRLIFGSSGKGHIDFVRGKVLEILGQLAPGAFGAEESKVGPLVDAATSRYKHFIKDGYAALLKDLGGEKAVVASMEAVAAP